MDIETVRNLIQLMVDNDLAELEVQDGETRVVLKRQGEQAPIVSVAPATPAAAQASASQTPQADAAEGEDDGLIAITSPMVGTFFAAPDPESPPYVQPGSVVEPDTVVCVVEAMKVYNEIKAEVSGVIERILVRSEEAVEFGQRLFLVRPT